MYVDAEKNSYNDLLGLVHAYSMCIHCNMCCTYVYEYGLNLSSDDYLPPCYIALE